MQTRQVRTTIVIPNYNGIKYLEKCLDTCRQQTVPVRIIVVENASSDGSRQVLETYEKQYPDQITAIYNSENTGFCKACNQGIDLTGTEYLFLLNNDTEIAENCVEELERTMDRHEDAFGVGAKMLSLQYPDLIDDAGDFYCALGWAFGRGQGKSSGYYQKEDRIFSPCGGAALYKTELVKELGGFDEAHFAYLEDMDLGYRGRLAGFYNYFCPKALVYHAGSAVSGSRHNAFKVGLSSRNSVYLILKNMPLIQILINLPFLLLGFAIKTLFFCKKGLGGIYLRGLGQGFGMRFCENGRERVRLRKKIAGKNRNLGAVFWQYGRIQLELWKNLLVRVKG